MIKVPTLSVDVPVEGPVDYRGQILHDGERHPLTITKKLRIPVDRAQIEVSYEIENLSDDLQRPSAGSKRETAL